jgi:hypothetical protein
MTTLILVPLDVCQRVLDEFCVIASIPVQRELVARASERATCMFTSRVDSMPHPRR